MSGGVSRQRYDWRRQTAQRYYSTCTRHAGHPKVVAGDSKLCRTIDGPHIPKGCLTSAIHSFGFGIVTSTSIITAFRMLVSGYDHAARHHGGAGALYVRLRRRD